MNRHGGSGARGSEGTKARAAAAAARAARRRPPPKSRKRRPPKTRKQTKRDLKLTKKMNKAGARGEEGWEAALQPAKEALGRALLALLSSACVAGAVAYFDRTRAVFWALADLPVATWAQGICAAAACGVAWVVACAAWNRHRARRQNAARSSADAAAAAAVLAGREASRSAKREVARRRERQVAAGDAVAERERRRHAAKLEADAAARQADQDWSASQRDAFDAALVAHGAACRAAVRQSNSAVWREIAHLVKGKSAEACEAEARVVYHRHRVASESAALEALDAKAALESTLRDGAGLDLGAAGGRWGWTRSRGAAPSSSDGDGEPPVPCDDATSHTEALANREKLTVELQPAHRGTCVRVTFHGNVNLYGGHVALAVPTRVDLQVICTRCGDGTDLTLCGVFADDASKTWHCRGCGTTLEASLRPCVLHEGSQEKLCYFDARRCRVADVVKVSLRVTCARCDGEDPNDGAQDDRSHMEGHGSNVPSNSALMKNCVRGRRSEAACGYCSAKMALQIDALDIERLDDGGGGATAAGGNTGGRGNAWRRRQKQVLAQLENRTPSASRDRAQGVPGVGNPLPNQGTCLHFRKSKRCCHKVYACPICHANDNAAGGCPAVERGEAHNVRANRMLCGRCSKEQSFSDSKVCVGCGFNFGNRNLKAGGGAARGTGEGAHWNGGEGSRDTGLLSRKERRKHKGVSVSGTKKTTSKKAHRVGLLGKKNREKKNEK